MEAVAPKRERGRQRVALLLDAGAEVFARRGFEPATMSEIAARADTAIGSLYRFFPTKDALADALVARYVAEVGGTIDDLAEAAPTLSPAAIADALFDMMLDTRRARAAATVLIDLRGSRAALRERVRHGIAAILRRAHPALDDADAAVHATVLLHLLKGVRTMAEEPEAADAKLADLRDTIRAYVADRVGRP